MQTSLTWSATNTSHQQCTDAAAISQPYTASKVLLAGMPLARRSCGVFFLLTFSKCQFIAVLFPSQEVTSSYRSSAIVRYVSLHSHAAMSVHVTSPHISDLCPCSCTQGSKRVKRRVLPSDSKCAPSCLLSNVHRPAFFRVRWYQRL